MASKIPRRSGIPTTSPRKIPKPQIITKSPAPQPLPQPVPKVSRIPGVSSPAKPAQSTHEVTKTENGSFSKIPHFTSPGKDSSENGCSPREEANGNNGKHIQALNGPQDYPKQSNSKREYDSSHSPEITNKENMPQIENKTTRVENKPHREITPPKFGYTGTGDDTNRYKSPRVVESQIPTVSGIPVAASPDSKIPISGMRPPAPPSEKKIPVSKSNQDTLVTAAESKIPVSRSSSEPSHNSKVSGIPVKSGSEKRFETFLMTGDAMIRTSETPCKIPKVSSKNVSKSESSDGQKRVISRIPPASSQRGSKASDEVLETIIHSSPEKRPRVENLEMAEVDELLETCENFMENENNCTADTNDISGVCEIEHYESEPENDVVQNSDCLHIDNENTAESFEQQEYLNEPSCESSDINTEDEQSLPSQECSPHRSIVMSKSDEKLVPKYLRNHQQDPLRASKSQENCLEGNELRVVDIDLEDLHAASYDALHYDSKVSSPVSTDEDLTPNHEHIGYLKKLQYENEQNKKILLNSPENKLNRLSQQPFMPQFIRLDGNAERETTPESSGGGNSDKDYEDNVEIILEREMEEKVVGEDGTNGEQSDSGVSDSVSDSEVEDKITALSPARNLSSPDSEDSDQESLYFRPPKAVDEPSAQRLAKRLYNLEGFKKSDVCKHLSKNNDFAQFVANEYLGYFDFTSMTLDQALRQFMSHFSLSGETQERERVLAHFSHRYLQCNPGVFNSDDSCHTLTCAIMLLNTDLHGQNIGRKMTCSEFIDNLAELNDGENFTKDILKNIFTDIKNTKIEWAMDECLNEDIGGSGDGRHLSQEEFSKLVGANPFLEIPDPSKATEYKKGYVMRKCCLDHDGRRTALGKRNWKMFYASLRDMVLYLHKDEQSYKKSAFDNVSNSIRIHHSLAMKADDYKKKQHVFRLKTADWSEYLIQTSNPAELDDWIDNINFIAASLSAPPLAAAVGSQRKFQRPLMPSSYTKLNLREQLLQHQCRELELERDLLEHQKNPPEKGAKSRVTMEFTEREDYLHFELERFRIYAKILQSKMAAYPELEPTLVETAIGEVDEPPQSPISSPSDINFRQLPRTSKAIQRSHSDRKNSGDEHEDSEEGVWQSNTLYINTEDHVTYL